MTTAYLGARCANVDLISPLVVFSLYTSPIYTKMGLRR